MRTLCHCFAVQAIIAATSTDSQRILTNESQNLYVICKGSSIVTLITPEGLYEMMAFGYRHMERLDRAGELSRLCGEPSLIN